MAPLLVVMVAACGRGVTNPTTSSAPTATISPSTSTPVAPTPSLPGTHRRASRTSMGDWTAPFSVSACCPVTLARGVSVSSAAPGTRILMTVEGPYWVLNGGEVFTALDVDPGLMAEQMAILAAAVEAKGGQSIESPYLASLRDHYRSDEFQIGLTALVRWLGLGGLPAEWAEQWGWFVQAECAPVPAELIAWADAIRTLDEAARKWVRDLEIVFVDGTWRFPVEAFEEELATQIDGASICRLFVELPETSPEILIKVDGERDRRRIEVLVVDKTYTDREPELMSSNIM